MPRVSPSVYFAGFDDHSHVRGRSGPKRQIEILGLVLFFLIIIIYILYYYYILFFSFLGHHSLNSPSPYLYSPSWASHQLISPSPPSLVQLNDVAQLKILIASVDNFLGFLCFFFFFPTSKISFFFLFAYVDPCTEKLFSRPNF